MKISIIVPVYNTESYLEECLNSLVQQTLNGIEILVVDDGSTDGSLKIAEHFQDQFPWKVKVFAKENGGQASARNVALERAQGEYLGFVDSDDWVDTTMYQQMYEAAVEQSADIVICDMVDHYPDHSIYHHASTFEDKFKVTGSACNKIFKKELVGTDVFSCGLWYEDFEFTTKQLMKTENIATVHKGFYHCHCREESTMNNNNSLKNLDILSVLENLRQFIQEKGWQERYAQTLEYLYLDHVLITSVNRVQRQTGKEKRGVIRQMIKTVRKKYPTFVLHKVFREMPRNRKIVAVLNSVGLSYVSKLLVDLKWKTK